MEDAEIVDRVKRAVEDALALEPAVAARLEPATNLVDDLGAESLDFLDLLFRLEDEFEIVLPQREFRDADRLGLTDADLAAPDGTLTAAAIERVRSLVPGADPRRLVPGLKRQEIVRCLTIRSFADLVRRKLDEKARASA